MTSISAQGAYYIIWSERLMMFAHFRTKDEALDFISEEDLNEEDMTIEIV